MLKINHILIGFFFILLLLLLLSKLCVLESLRYIFFVSSIKIKFGCKNNETLYIDLSTSNDFFQIGGLINKNNWICYILRVIQQIKFSLIVEQSLGNLGKIM